MIHKLLEKIHDKAWGKSWPTVTCTVQRRDIFPDETDDSDGNEDIDIGDANNYDDGDGRFGHIAAKGTFTCLLDVDQLQLALGIPGTKFSVIVIREEYKFLRELLEKKDKPFVVTGQPGIGKTMFLLYLLIYRLELALPTAVQFSPDHYIVFRADGVSVCATDYSTDHLSMLPAGCWCLSDGNSEVMHPCEPFQRSDLRTFLFTSSRCDSYKEWLTQTVADKIVTALPQAIEVAAIAKMHGWEPCDAVSIMRKWGPCISTVVAILGDPDQENNLRRYAVSAATDISNDPWKVSLQEGSDLLFICPIRCKDNPDYGDSRLIIPTMHLSEIFDYQCQGFSEQSIMRLHEVFFRVHTTTMDSADWQHKKNTHIQMMKDGECYDIFNGGSKSHMNSAAPLSVGTASALRAAVRDKLSSFLWFPSLVNYPGIDGVLVNGNNIYALQATTADTHEGPRDGLKKLWKTIGADMAHLFTWHFVMITDNKPLADKCAADLGTQLHDVALGRQPHVRVSAWVCVLKSDPQSWDGGSSVGESWFASVVGVLKRFSGMS